jgi:hypothetical protein
MRGDHLGDLTGELLGVTSAGALEAAALAALAALAFSSMAFILSALPAAAAAAFSSCSLDLRGPSATPPLAAAAALAAACSCSSLLSFLVPNACGAGEGAMPVDDQQTVSWF